MSNLLTSMSHLWPGLLFLRIPSVFHPFLHLKKINYYIKLAFLDFRWISGHRNVINCKSYTILYSVWTIEWGETPSSSSGHSPNEWRQMEKWPMAAKPSPLCYTSTPSPIRGSCFQPPPPDLKQQKSMKNPWRLMVLSPQRTQRPVSEPNH